MHIELIDLLRCPRDHDETWLVAALNAVQDRYVIKAKLGCPVCGESYSIRNGIADLRAGESVIATSEPKPPDADEAIRIAAFLNLTRPGSLVVLEGNYANLASAISEMTECRVLALNPCNPIDDTERIASILSDSRIPLGTTSIDAIAFDNDNLIGDATRVLKPSARLVAAATTTLPPGLMEIARDKTAVVAEAPANLVSLRR